jgi:hypothetical protein
MPKFIKLIIIIKNYNNNVLKNLKIFRKTKTIKITFWIIIKLMFLNKFYIKSFYKYKKCVKNKENKK